MGSPNEAAAMLDGLVDVAMAEMAATGVPGVALGVVSRGSRASIGLGVANVRQPAAVTPTTLFRLCSVSKPLTATLTAVLADEGLLDLDAPVTSYLRELELSADPALGAITVRHLMLHTSGLESELGTDLHAYGDGEDAYQRMLDDFGTLRRFAPAGQLWGYCNTGYWLLGAIVARRTGMSFEAAMHRYLLEPLVMADAVFSAEDAILRHVALPHQPANDDSTHELVPSFAFPRVRRPSGGVIACVDDVLRFAALHLGEAHLVGTTMLTDLHRPAVASFDDAQQSPAWAVELIGGLPVLFHGGSFSGYNTWLSIFPQHQVALAVLTNSSQGRLVIRAVDESVRQSLLGWTPKPPRFTELSTDELSRFVGRYEYPTAGSVEVRAEDGKITIQLPTSSEPGSPRIDQEFWPVSANEFARPDRERIGADLVFLPDDSSGALRMRLGNRLGLRVQPGAPH